MAKRKRPTKQPAVPASASSQAIEPSGSTSSLTAAAHQRESIESSAAGGHRPGRRQSRAPGSAWTEFPSPRIRWTFSILIVLHFSALLLAIASNLYQSQLQQIAIRTLSPYLVATSQVYGALPLEWTHAEDYDFPLQIEVRRDGREGWEVWVPGSLDQTSFAQSRWHNFARILSMITAENPESEIVAEFGMRLARTDEALNAAKRTVTPITTFRLVRKHVPSFDQASVISEGNASLLETSDTVVYQASVIREQGELIGLIPLQESYRSAKAISADSATQQNSLQLNSSNGQEGD